LYADIVALAYVSLVVFFFSSFCVLYYFLLSRNWSSIDLCVYFNSLLLNKRLFAYIPCSFMYLPQANSEENAIHVRNFSRLSLLWKLYVCMHVRADVYMFSLMVKQKFPVYKQSYIFKISIPSPSSP